MVWDRGEYQAAPAADHGTLRRKMGLALVFGVPDEIETADQIDDSRRGCPADLQCEPAPAQRAWQTLPNGNSIMLNTRS
jgi:hypothetical protein